MKTSRQARAITAILENPTLERAAEAIGVNPKTLNRWMRDPLFLAELSSAENKLIGQATRRLVQLADKALDALENVLSDPSQRGASNKRLAAGAILDNLMKLRELHGLEQRLIALEELVFYDRQK